MFNNFGSTCDALTKCVHISHFIKGNNWVTEDIFPFITI